MGGRCADVTAGNGCLEHVALSVATWWQGLSDYDTNASAIKRPPSPHLVALGGAEREV